MKNVIFKKSILLFGLLLVFQILQAQNSTTILAPRYFNPLLGPAPIPLPTSPTPNGYAGQPASHVQNIEVDPQGNILFFIVDENIYG